MEASQPSTPPGGGGKSPRSSPSVFGAIAGAVGKAAGQAGRGLARIRTRSALRARGETVTPLHADGQVAVALMDAARVAAEAAQIAVATAALTSDFAEMVEQNAAVAASASSPSTTAAPSTTASAPEGKSGFTTEYAARRRRQVTKVVPKRVRRPRGRRGQSSRARLGKNQNAFCSPFTW